eukprot:Skav215337  [mRNA]  locus=scaffold1391:201335:207023:- [translate_table: standard]
MGTGVLAAGAAGYPTDGKGGICKVDDPLSLAKVMPPCGISSRQSFVGAISQDARPGPQPVAALAASCRELWQQLRDPRTTLQRPGGMEPLGFIVKVNVCVVLGQS